MKENLRLVIDSRSVDGKILGISLSKIKGSDTWELIHENIRYVITKEKP